MVRLQDIALTLGNKQLFNGFSLRAAPGEKLLIRGASGSGKTTLLRMILGFVRPDEGRILIDEEEMKEDNVWALRRRMAYVSQGLQIGSGRVDHFIREILAYRHNRHLSYDEGQVLDYFQRFRLERDKLQQSMGALSGGERQRVALIVALLLDRELYLLDEATSGLDDTLREIVIDHLSGLTDKTVIAVSHDQDWQTEAFRNVRLD